jgi:hypothetical protein
MADLRAHGVTFEDYDFGELKTVDTTAINHATPCPSPSPPTGGDVQAQGREA